MPSFALLDVVSPYVMGGAAIGEPWHELLSALFVTEIETAFDDNGICISGIARFSADLDNFTPRYVPPATITWAPNATVNHTTQRTAGAYWELPDIAITFRLTAPRTSSPVADQILPGLNNAAVGTLLGNFGRGMPPPGQPAADAPGTVFHLDLLLDAATLHLPFLTGALLQPDGVLAVDPTNPEVTVTLPKIKLSFDQTAGIPGTADPQMTLTLDSFAAQDIDDPSGAGYGEVIRMQPPYALLGPDDVLGFGFNSVILDLSGTETPPQLLDKYGVGADFRGIYLPDVRVFVKVPGAKGMSIDVSARELLIGLGPEGGLSAIFGVDIVNPDKPQAGTITIYDEFGGMVDRIALPELDTGTIGGPLPTYTSPPAPVPRKSQWVVDVTGGQPPYNISIDNTQQTDQPVSITLTPDVTERTIHIEIVDVHTQRSRVAEIPIYLLPPSLTAPEGGIVAAFEPAISEVITAGPPGYTILIYDYPSQEAVTLLVTPPEATVEVKSNGVAMLADFVNGRASVSLAHGKNIDVSATWTVKQAAPGSTTTFNAQFQYDQPLRPNPKAPVDDPNDPAWEAFSKQSNRIQTHPSEDAHDPDGKFPPPTEPVEKSSAFTDFLAIAKANSGTAITLIGEASKENQKLEDYNVALSQRRIWVIQELLESKGATNAMTFLPRGEQPPEQDYPGAPGRGLYRRVIASIAVQNPPTQTTYNAAIRIIRAPRKPAPPVFKPPVIKREAPGNEKFRFREFHLRLQLDHNKVIALELRLKIDITTVLESYLTRVKQQQNPPGGGQGATVLPVGRLSDPNDGVLDMRFQLTLDSTVGRWEVRGSFFEQDSDGFLQTPPPVAVATGPVPENFWRDYFGVMIATIPLLDATASADTVPGNIVALAAGAALPLAVVALDIVHVPRITFYGGEIIVGHDPNGTRVAVLLDVEVALLVTLDLGGSTKLIDTDPNNPITVRYKAVGFATSDQPQFNDIVPVFDSSKGYTINIPSGGGITVPGPLGDILQVAGTRIARSNPVNIELDLNLKADLGVVTIDKTTIRIPLEGGHVPTVSALGVHIDIAGAIEGGGYLAIYDNGFAGQLDVSLPSLGVRVSGGLSVRQVTDEQDPSRKATAILITLEVDFPVPIALGNSGLGIYGFGGLFALHHRRDERETDPVPALDWLIRVNGNPTDITGWIPDIDNWAIGLGAVLGTMDAGFIINVKGMLIYEMPGPRVLFVMKAKILAIRPPRQGNPTATILAVIDLDLGRGRITIGLTFDYDIKPMLSIHVPVRAIFPFEDLAHFAIDAGTWYAPASVTFFELFKARGYVMIRGKGIPDTAPDSYDSGATTLFPLSPLGGFSLATGVSASFIWGDKGSGLYISVGGSADFGIGFSPIIFSGELRIWGELHLWVVSIEASARLSVLAGQIPDGPPVPDPDHPGELYQPTRNTVQIDGEVHGKVDCFFFNVEGSVHVTLGSKPSSAPEPPPLLTGISLQSRSAALLSGVSSDRPIDGKLADAHEDVGGLPGAPVPAGEAVPIDSIIVLHFDCTPRVDGAFAVRQNNADFTVPLGPPVGSTSPAVRRGEPYYTYRIRKITLDNPLTPGAVPVVWWPSVPNPGPESKRELALLTRVPDAHPSAVERSKHAEDFIAQHWETVCTPAAPPAPVLFTFHDSALGPSPTGWIVDGIAWPDPPGTTRDTPPRLRLDIAETWRSGDGAADMFMDISPARIIGGPVTCPQGCGGKIPSPIFRPRPRQINTMLLSDDLATGGLLSTGSHVSIRDSLLTTSTAEQMGPLNSFIAANMKTRLATPKRGCFARVLEAPFLRVGPKELFNDHPLADVFASLYGQMEQRPGEFADIVALSTGEIARLRGLLYVPNIVLDKGLMELRCFDRNGNIVARIGISDISRRVSKLNDVPKEWLDPEKPWRCRVLEVLDFLDIPDPRRDRPGSVVLAETDVPKETAYIHFGIHDVELLTEAGIPRPSYLVALIETLATAELVRHDSETLIKNHQQSEINGGLTAMAAPPALLLPDTEYAVRIDWEYATCDANGGGQLDWKQRDQTYRFRTDRVPLAPRVVRPPGEDEQGEKTLPSRLDPWVLTTDPDEGENFYFYGSPVRIVLSVDYLLSMFQTYGVALQAKVRASSFRNVSPTSPGFANTIALLNDAVTAAVTGGAINAEPLVGSSVLTPWEDMARDVLADKPCVDTLGAVTRHTIVDLNLLLEPVTDYILDVEPVDSPQPEPRQPARPMFRRSFVTSRYANPEEMCASVGQARFTELPAGDISAIEALAGAPAPLSRSQIDDALGTAGLRPVLDVASPEVEVMWSGSGGTQQPRVLVLRTPEPLVRTRKQPVNIEPPGQPRLQREVIVMEDRPYLEVVASADVPGSAGLTIISQPGLNVVIALVAEGRGKPISLSLRRHDSAFLGEVEGTSDIDLFTMTLQAAIWEVV
ncbi:cadherin-like beta sandwich domain-containing protein [Rhizobium sp. SYY.PMSO]|uniref:cadherin-like beta sandwich domain-containing protein n=1 Tax=Rhizobium sp. SYY.PMSO TaxID=3382192 RepID=UPI0039901211